MLEIKDYFIAPQLYLHGISTINYNKQAERELMQCDVIYLIRSQVVLFIAVLKHGSWSVTRGET